MQATFLLSLRRVSPLVLATVSENVNKEVAHYLEGIASLSQKAATALACSSILVGQGNEADDLGDDVAVWLGPGEYENPVNVLNAFGLNGLYTKDVPLTSQGLPPTLRVTEQVDALDQWIEETKRLSDKYCFRVSVDQSTVLFVLVGRLEDFGWAALVGAGAWSDGVSD